MKSVPGRSPLLASTAQPRSGPAVAPQSRSVTHSFFSQPSRHRRLPPPMMVIAPRRPWLSARALIKISRA